MKKLTIALSALIMLLGLQGPAMAQEAPSAAPEQAPSSGQQFSDDQLQSFADVQANLQQIQVEYTQQLQNAEDEAQTTEIQQEAASMMREAIQEQGLEVETYTQIAMALQNNQALQERIRALIGA